MIAVDTSALMSIVLDEPEAEACATVLASNERLLISAGTLAEVLIVSARRDRSSEMRQMIQGLGFEIVSITPEAAHRIAEAYARWGKGLHPAGLNFGDCFAYDVAKSHGCPLLYVGNDFARTDISSVL